MARLEKAWRWLGANPSRAALVLGLCAFAFAVPGIGNLDGLGHTDEHFYLSIAADTYDTGHIAPSHDGSPIFQKPPLVFWVARLCMALLGRSGTAARMPGAIAAALLVAAGTLFTAEVAGAALGPLAGAFLLGCLGVARFDRVLMLDLPLSACLGWALWAAARAVRSPGRIDAGFAILAGALASGCLAIKGPIGVGVLGLAGLIALARERRFDLLRSGRFWAGVALGLCVSAPWYVWAIATHPREFFAFHIQEQYLSRFESTHGQSRWNLFLGTLLYAAPFWPLAVLAALPGRAGSARLRAGGSTFSGSAGVLAGGPATTGIRWSWIVGWLVAFYGIFLLPKEHGLHYPLLVLIPLAAAAATVTGGAGLRAGATAIRMAQGAIALALLCGAAGLVATLAFPETPRIPALIATMLAVGAAASMLSSSPARLALAFLLAGAASNLAVASLAPVFARPLLSPQAAELGRREPVALLTEHPGPYRLSAGWGSEAKEIWGDRALNDAIDQRELVFAPDHALRGAPERLVSQLEPVVEWRRTRPYLGIEDIWLAWKARDLDLLGERCALYRARPPPR